jgi:hypothetical protein
MIVNKRKFNDVFLAVLGKNGDDAAIKIMNPLVPLIVKHCLN